VEVKEGDNSEHTFGKKENSIAVPTAALMSFGVYTRPPFPTVTEIVVPACALAVAAIAATRPTVDENCMMKADSIKRERW